MRVGSTAVINATEVGLDGVPPNSMFGDRATQEPNYAAHDPATLADPNLRDTRILLFTGNGQPGPLDPPPPALPNADAMSIEMLVWRDTHEFHDRLDDVGIPHFFDDYGPGTHTWPYWARDLRATMGPLMDAFAHPPARPARVTYTSAEDAYGVYDWRVTMHRTAREFSTLKGVGADRRLRLDVPLGRPTPTRPRRPRPRSRAKVFETTATITRVRGRKRA